MQVPHFLMLLFAILPLVICHRHSHTKRLISSPLERNAIQYANSLLKRLRNTPADTPKQDKARQLFQLFMHETKKVIKANQSQYWLMRQGRHIYLYK